MCTQLHTHHTGIFHPSYNVLILYSYIRSNLTITIILLDPDSVSPGSINSSSSQSTMKINDEHHSNHSQSSLLANDNVQGKYILI